MLRYSVLFFSLACTDYNLHSKSTSQDVELFPEIYVDPGQINLGFVCEEQARDVWIRNDGDGVLEVQALTITGTGWTVLNDPTPFALEPDEIRGLTVAGEVGDAILEIQTNDLDNPVVSIPLSALADQPPILQVITPYDGEIIDEAMVFEAMVSDDLDSPETLMVVWSSDQEGSFSTNAPALDGSLQAIWSSGHQAGYHRVDVSVTDSCGNTTIDSFGICQQMVYETENLDVSSWNFEGTAQWDSANNWVELTSTATNQAGSAFSTAQTVSGSQVEIEFLFYMSDGTGADGISVTALDVDRMTSFFGATGGGIGYEGLPGWSIEVDNYYNGHDPTPEDHLTFSFDGNVYTPEIWVALPDMEDGNWHQMRVVVSAPHVFVEIDHVTYLDQDIQGFYNFDSYVGFTAATGSLTNQHLIDSLVVTEQVCGD